LFLAHLNISGREADSLYAGRSYFGVLRVYMDFDSGALLADPDNDNPENKDRIVFDKGVAPYTYLMHGTTYHGKNFHYPEGLRRLPTTYYHRKGPVGVLMERWNWGSNLKDLPPQNWGTSTKELPFQNTYYADARLP